jgi:hypothetical protein
MRRMRVVPIPVLLLLLQVVVSPAGAEDVQQAATDPAPSSQVGLDALLRLPAQSPTPAREPAGLSDRKEWEARFEAARAELEAARAALAASQAELGELASGGNAWQMAPPGAGANAENSPVSFKLRQDIRRQRGEVAEAERALTELRIQANLAGIPEDWQD